MRQTYLGECWRPERLRTEINKKLDALAKEKKPWVAEWIAHSICNEHKEALDQSEDADFWLHCGYVECRDQVRRCIGARAGDRPEKNTEQLAIDGFDYLQPYYMVEREGQRIGVSVYSMTRDELLEKAATYRRMGASCYAHADEIAKFMQLLAEAKAA